MLQAEHLRNLPNSRAMIASGKNFVYLEPCASLKPLISNVTITFPDQNMISDHYTIMPHGSVTLVMFSHHQELHRFLFGPTTKPVKVGNLANQCEVIFIIEFQPAGFYPFCKDHQKELRDEILPFACLNHTLDQALSVIFKEANSVEELLTRVEKELQEHQRMQIPKELKQAIEVIIDNAGVISTEEITNQIFYSSRQINRMFNQYLGMSMKAFSRLVRMNKAIQYLNDPHMTTNDICERLGYYDDSHFIKDFKIVCEITPLTYRCNMSDFYSEIAKY